MPSKCKVTPLTIITLLILFTFYSTAVADELLSLKAGYQLLSPSGTIAGSVGGDTPLNVKSDLDLDDSGGLTGEIALNWGRSRLSVNYLPISFSGTGTLKFDGIFNGQIFAQGDELDSTFEIALYDIGYSYFIVNLDDLPTRFQLGLEVAVKVADSEVIVRNLHPDRLFTERESALVPIPTVGLRSRIALADFLGITGRIGYMEVDANRFLDAEAQLEFSPVPMLGLYAGYRYFDLKIDEKDLYVETDFSGPFGGLMVRF